MEIPVINRISGLEATVCTLHTPSFLSQLISLSGIDRIPRPSSFWKWSALVLLILASFGAMINKIKVWMIRFQKETSNPLLRPLLYDTDFDDSCSSCSSEDSDDDDEYDVDEDEEPTAREEFRSMADDRRRGGAVFAVKGFQNQWNQNGSSNLRQRRSIGEHLSELACGKSVVKLWENLGLGLGLELQGESNSFLDSGEERKSNLSSSSFLPPPSVIYTSATTWSPLASVRLWDTRAASKKPAILTEWGSLVGNVDAIGYGGLTKLYLRDGGELAAVRDLRRAGDPLDNVTESDMEKWWPSLLTVMGRAGMALTPP